LVLRLPYCFITFGVKKKESSIDYVGVEAYPITADEPVSMNYVKNLMQ
jgi:hypothetical protein